MSWCCSCISLRLLLLASLRAWLPMRAGLRDLLGDLGGPGELSMGWGGWRMVPPGGSGPADSSGRSGMGLSGGRPEDPLDRNAGLLPDIQSFRLGWRMTKRELEPPEPAQSRREGSLWKASMWSSREAGLGMARGADLGPQVPEKGESLQLPPSTSLSEEPPLRASSWAGAG